jgi:hypothetical protein
VALLTDFGPKDWYVASIKAAALTANPHVNLVDIAHEITPGSISEGAFVLKRCYNDFPSGTTFLVVVDPGVGTTREAVIIRAGGYFFVGPNNGVLYPTISQYPDYDVVQIENPAWMGSKTSSTFHGRDLFAPAAGRLSSGASFGDAGREVQQLIPFEFPSPTDLNGISHGQIIYFARFGNGLTNLLPDHVELNALSGLRLADTLFPLGTTFGEVDEGDPVSYWGSSGFLEVAVRNGNAKSEYKLEAGSVVEPV